MPPEAGVAGVVMTLRDSDGTQIGQQPTNDQGLATFANIAPGRYTVQSDRTTTIPGHPRVDVIEAEAAARRVRPAKRQPNLRSVSDRLPLEGSPHCAIA